MTKQRIGWMMVAVVVLAAMVEGCKTKQLDYARQLPPGELALRRITNPADLPDFSQGCLNRLGLRDAIDNSLNYFAKPSSEQFYLHGDITHQRAVATLQAFEDLMVSGMSPAQMNRAIQDKFDVYISVGCDDKGTVQYTGYYTPIFDGSRQPDGRFKYPLYRQPPDLVKGPDGAILGQQSPGGQINHYPPRAQLEDGAMLKGLELVWLADLFEVYIAHVQGSAKIRLPDGSLMTVSYAAHNGYDYHGISEDMIADGKLRREQLSLAAMIDYFKANPQDVEKYTRKNPRFVFFREESGSPRGSINEPVIAMRSIATDKSIFPRGCLAFIDTRLPQRLGGEIMLSPYRGFALDQDSGGAIRAAGRCDVYMGQGDEAGALAGQTYQEGRLYYLFLKSDSLRRPPLSSDTPAERPAGQSPPTDLLQ